MLKYCILTFVLSTLIAKSLGQHDSSVEFILKELDELRGKQGSCDAKINELEKTVDDLKAEVERLKHVKQHIQNPELDHDEKEETINNLTSAVREHFFATKHVSRKQRQVDSRIAFTAGVGTFHVVHLGDHHTIAFDKVLTNIGNAYSPNTGIFTAPFRGAYSFTLTFMVYGRHSEYLEIVVDGANINDIYADASSVDVVMSTTKQWVLELNKGSQVWIRTTDYYNQGEIHGNMHTMFSGFLLFEME